MAPKFPALAPKLPALALAALLLLTCLPLAGADDDVDEWERAFHGLLPDPDPDSRLDADEGRLWHVTRILAADTGAPVPGAELLWYPERLLDWWIEHAFLLGRGLADERGFAFIAADDETWNDDAHWIVDAPGYAPSHDYAVTPPEFIWLERGHSVTGRAVDAHGRPVADVRVDYFKGCGHAPVLRTARTDAAGLFTLESVDPDEGQLWIEAPGTAVDYRGIDELFEYGDRVHDFVLAVGWTARGRVLDERGAPIQGVVVRSLQTHRGPARMTAADGSFVLPAVAPGEALAFHHPATLRPENTGVPSTDDFDMEWLDDRLFTVRLSPLGLVEAPPPDATLRVRITTEDGGEPLGYLSFLAVRLADGLARESYTSEGPESDDEATGERSLDVRAGRWRIEAVERFAEYVFDPVTVDIAPNAAVEVPIVARRQPRLVIENQPDDWQWMLLVGGGGDEQQNDPSEPWSPHVPAAGPVTLWLRSRDECPLTLFEAGPVRGGVRTVTVDLPSPHRIRVRDSSAGAQQRDAEIVLELVLRGTRITTHFEEPHPSRDDGFHTTYASGALDLRAVHDDGTVQRVPLDLPDAGGTTVDVDLARYPRLAASATGEESAIVDVRLADGSRPVGGTVVEYRSDGQSWGELGHGWTCQPDSLIVIRIPGHRVVEIRPGGPGRHVVELGSCSLRVSVTDSIDEALYDEAIVWVDDAAYLTQGNRLDLAGLDPGPHDVIVAARDADASSIRSGKRLRLVLTAGDVREVKVTLPLDE